MISLPEPNTDTSLWVFTASDGDSALSFSYNTAGQMTRIDNAGTTGVPHTVIDITYSGNGLREAISVAVAGVLDHTNIYDYDDAGRVVAITQTGPAIDAKRVELAIEIVTIRGNGRIIVVSTSWPFIPSLAALGSIAR